MPRCPNDKLAISACVTQKCNASPYICESINNCACNNAHRYCKIMKWTSIIQVLQDYQQNLPEIYKLYIKRIEKIYNNIIGKLKTEIKLFYQYFEERLYGGQYAKIKHYLNKQDYNKISCYSLGTIISKMTQRIQYKNSDQQGYKNLQKFTLNQMRVLDQQIQTLLRKIQQLYKQKFHVIEKQLTEIHSNQVNKNSSFGTNHTSRSMYNRSEMSSYKQKNKDLQTLQSLKGLSQSHIMIFKRSQSNESKKIFSRTTQSKFQNKMSPVKNISELLQSKHTQLWNSSLSSPIKSDLTYPKFINSKIITNATILNHLLEAKPKQYKIIYRASQNNFQIQQFYKNIARYTFANEGSKISNNQTQPLTLLLIQTQFGKVLGGITRLKWTRNNKNKQDDDQQQQQQKYVENYKEDIRGTSFIFSIDLNEKYNLNNPKYGIYCGRKSIGFGKNDIKIVNHSHKHSKNYIGFPSSYNNGFYLPVKKSSLILSGSHDSAYFKITQWQMFQVIFSNKQKSLQNKAGIKNNSIFTLTKDNNKIINNNKELL